jgi:hypothetical protein
MSPTQRGELENIVNAQIAGIVVLSRHLKWIKSSETIKILRSLFGHLTDTVCYAA